MKTAYSISEITNQEYMTSKQSQRIINSSFPNYFYKLEIADSFIFIDSNDNSTEFKLEYVDKYNELIFASEDRVYIFSTNDAKVKFATRTFDPMHAIRILDGFYLLFTEKVMFSILSSNCSLLHSQSFPDLIEDIKVHGRNINVTCFGGNIFNVTV
ncbi:hypothetical protein BH09BAC3_BH09BAC3_38580 [soil metagenome]